MALKRILYLTDKSGVSSGYQPLFNQLLAGRRLLPNQVFTTSLYNLIDKPLKKQKSNSKTWILDKEKYTDAKVALDLKIQHVKPSLIVTCCPIVLGVVTLCDPATATIEKTRGSVYEYNGIPVVITYPISAINRRTTDKTSKELEDIEGITPYIVKSGHKILIWDWEKAARIFSGKTRDMPAFDYSVCRTFEDVLAAAKFLIPCVVIAEDIETKGAWIQEENRSHYFQTCVGFTGLRPDGKMKTFVIPFFDQFTSNGAYWTIEEAEKVWEIYEQINDSESIKMMANGSYDASYFIRDRVPCRNYIGDPQHMWHSVFPELRKSLDFLSSIFSDTYQYWKADIKGLEDKDITKRDTTMEKYWRYNALDCYYTMICGLLIWSFISKNPVVRKNYKHEILQMYAGLAMGMRGIKANKDRLMEHRVDLSCKAADALERLQFITGDPDFNPNSTVQMCYFFYDILGVGLRSAKGKQIPTGSKIPRSAASPALEQIKFEHPLWKDYVDAVYDAKRPAKQISNICNMKLDTNRFRYALGASATETRRYNGKSSNFWDGTNPQNITKKMRDWLVADPGWIMFDCDYSQSDAVFVAYESNDPLYIETMTCGKDSHALHAEDFFKIPYDQIIAGKKADDPFITHPQTGIRPLSKRVVHGANFQMEAYTLFTTMGKLAVMHAAEQLGHTNVFGMSEKQLISICSDMLHLFRCRYKRLNKNEWYGEIELQLKNFGYIDNAFGFRRYFLGSWKDPGTQREATAFLGQSGTASNMNRSMDELMFGYIPQNFRDGPNPHRNEKPIQIEFDPKKRIMFQLQVHDSFVGGVHRSDPNWQQHLNNILTVMERPCIINGHEMHVPAEMELMTKWSKGALTWNRDDPEWLDKIDLTSFS